MKLLDPQKEERIINAVIQIVGERGLTGINMSDISKKAGISVGTLYTYFEGKDEILRVAYIRTAKQVTYKMYEDFSIDNPIKQSLRVIFNKVLEYRTKHFDETILVDQYMQSKFVKLNRSTYFLEYKERNKPLFELMDLGQKSNTFRSVNVDVLINFFNGCVRSISNAIVQQQISYDKGIAETYFEMIWRGLTI